MKVQLIKETDNTTIWYYWVDGLGNKLTQHRLSVGGAENDLKALIENRELITETIQTKEI
jgi:hypothetical protein